MNVQLLEHYMCQFTVCGFGEFWESSFNEVCFPLFNFVEHLFACFKARGAFIGFSAPAGAADVSWQDRFTESI